MPLWFNEDWEFRKAITIDPLKVPSDQSDFPVLISVTDTDIAAAAQTDGDDILFTSSDGVTQLSHEIEKYVSGTGELVAWVKVPSVSGSVDTVLYVYYGNPTVGNQEDPINVWDADFVGVWHLKEDPGPGGAGDIKDSTSNANHGTADASMTPGDLVAAQVGDGIEMDGSDDLIDLLSPATLDNLGPLTISCWLNPATIVAAFFSHPVAKRLSAIQGRWTSELDDTSPEVNTYEFNLNFSGANLKRTSINNVISFDVWQHVVFTWDGSSSAVNVHIYKDGVELTYQATVDGGGSRDDDAAASVFIGGRDDGSGNFEGIIDEVRISKIVRTADWILTEFNNQDSPATFYAVGLQEEILVIDISKDGEYRILLADQDINKSAQYAMLLADIDVAKSGQYAVQPTAEVAKSAQYLTLQANNDLVKSALYRLQPTVDVAKSGLYRLIPTVDISKSGQYGLLDIDIDVVKSGQYSIVLVADIAKSGQYAVLATIDVTKSGTYHVIIPPEIVKSGQYRILMADMDKVLGAEYRILFAVDNDVVKSAEYRVKLVQSLVKAGVYSVISPTDIVVLGAYKIITENDIGVAGVYSVVTVQDIAKNAQYLILFQTDIDIVLSAQYAVQPTTNLLVNGKYAVQPTFDVSKFGQYKVQSFADFVRSGTYRVFATKDRGLLGEYRILGQADPSKDLDLHCPLSEELALELTLLEE